MAHNKRHAAVAIETQTLTLEALAGVPEVLSTHVFPVLDLASAQSLGLASRSLHAHYLLDRKRRSPRALRIPIGDDCAFDKGQVTRLIAAFASFVEVTALELVLGPSTYGDPTASAKAAMRILGIPQTHVTSMTIEGLRTPLRTSVLMRDFPKLDSIALVGGYAPLSPPRGLWTMQLKRVRFHPAVPTCITLDGYHSIEVLEFNENVVIHDAHVLVSRLNLDVTGGPPRAPERGGDCADGADGADVTFCAPSFTSDRDVPGQIHFRHGGCVSINAPGAKTIAIHSTTVPRIKDRGVRVNLSSQCPASVTLVMHPTCPNRKPCVFEMHNEVL
jgi:hypothetical protein